jgi:aldehyde:ferredoxin oxidoreductase
MNPEGMTLKEKMAAHRKYRESRYEQLLDAVYKRRGWDANGVPTMELLKKLGMDLPELVELRDKYEKGEWKLK